MAHEGLVDKRAYLNTIGCLIQDSSLIDDIDRPLDRTDFNTNEDLLKRILEERRLETAFDAGLRWFDLRRLGKPEIRHAYKNGTEYVLKQGDLRYVLQIPISEQNASPNMPLNPRD